MCDCVRLCACTHALCGVCVRVHTHTCAHAHVCTRACTRELANAQVKSSGPAFARARTLSLSLCCACTRGHTYTKQVCISVSHPTCSLAPSVPPARPRSLLMPENGMRKRGRGRGRGGREGRGGGGGGKPEDGIGLQVDPHATQEHGDAGTKAGPSEPLLLVDPHVLQLRHIVNLGCRLRVWGVGFRVWRAAARNRIGRFRLQPRTAGQSRAHGSWPASGPGHYTNRHTQTGRHAHRQMLRQRQAGTDTHPRV